MSNLGHKYSVIPVSETWAPINESGNKSESLESYHDYHGVKGNSLKSGCKIYFKEEINLNSCKDLEITYFDEDNEFRCGWIEFLNEKRSSIFAGLYYRHPKSSLITCFYQK